MGPWSSGIVRVTFGTIHVGRVIIFRVIFSRQDATARTSLEKFVEEFRIQPNPASASYKSSRFIQLPYQCRVGHTDDSIVVVILALSGYFVNLIVVVNQPRVS